MSKWGGLKGNGSKSKDFRMTAHGDGGEQERKRGGFMGVVEGRGD